MSEKNGIEELGVERGSEQVVPVTSAYVQLFEAPLYETPDEDGEAGDVLPDDLAELEVVRISHQSDGSGSFYLHNGDGVRIGPNYEYTANSGKFEPGRQKMGAGSGVFASVTRTSGTLRIWVEVQARRPVFRKRATQYPDA
jgi:hypothetical protein